jgi:hypothetical protein
VSRLTHALCWRCWDHLNPDLAAHSAYTERGPREVCCRCGSHTSSGIYYRADAEKEPGWACEGRRWMHAREEEPS